MVPEGWTAKQAAARSREEDAILTAINNSSGVGIVAGRILKLVETRLKDLIRREDAGEDVAGPMKNAVTMFREVCTVQKGLNLSLTPLLTAQRMNVGQPQQLTAHAHQHTVTAASGKAAPILPGAPPPLTPSATPSEARARMDRLMSSYARLSEPVQYDGEETGLVDRDDDDE